MANDEVSYVDLFMDSPPTKRRRLRCKTAPPACGWENAEEDRDAAHTNQLEFFIDWEHQRRTTKKGQAWTRTRKMQTMTVILLASLTIALKKEETTVRKCTYQECLHLPRLAHHQHKSLCRKTMQRNRRGSGASAKA
eukprot:5488795-Amphidinium_carterae.1